MRAARAVAVFLSGILGSACSLLYDSTTASRDAAVDSGFAVEDAPNSVDSIAPADARPAACTPMGYEDREPIGYAHGGPLRSPAVVRQNGKDYLFYTGYVSAVWRLYRREVAWDAAEGIIPGDPVEMTVPDEAVAVAPAGPDKVYLMSSGTVGVHVLDGTSLSAGAPLLVSMTAIDATGRPVLHGLELLFSQGSGGMSGLAVATDPSSVDMWGDFTPVNTGADCDFSPTFAPDGRTLLFSTNRNTTDCLGPLRVFQTTRNGMTWTAAGEVPGIHYNGIRDPWFHDFGDAVVLFTTGVNDEIFYRVVNCEPP